ncbi:shikimate kinase [Actinotignum schaalii]|uniref:Shikimate kinase n=1 Tax=Actinotignum schaalii FB123-CNA-2 TaxID=883067 RepID=S2VGN8_9ACTO|nr:shikimate kinase [Actinotignum schaalii]EPD26588.1 hypothetical protein HMPREF9237_01213 [Actinotignum schaalii FB123-CNA-2]MDE1653870.1 shikimate kinase [Actinotignum schaalii]
MSVRAVLVGMPGVGKSTVGKLLAKDLQLPFADSDALIVSETGQSIPEIFQTVGEEGFRRLEADIIARTLANFDGVLSLGGGAILSGATRQALRGYPVVLIEARMDILVRRITGSRTRRPLLEDNPAARLRELDRERTPLYRDVASVTVTSDGGSPHRVVRRIRAALDVCSEAAKEK